jgi:Kef-type K+ transport system membrane component KefB
MLDSLEVIGIAILAGFLVAKFIVRLKIPSVAAYVLIGVLFGQSVLNIFHEDMINNIGVINDIALGLIAFIIGGELRWKQLRQLGSTIFFIVIFEAFGAFGLVTFCVQLIFKQWELSLMLGAIAAATAPAATIMVIRELKAEGKFTKTLLSVVAIDDGIALLIYSFASAFAKSLLVQTSSVSISHILAHALSEIFCSLMIGIVAGYILSFLIKQFHNRKETYILAIGTLFIVVGLSNQLGYSSLLANLALGIVLVNNLPNFSRRIFALLDDLTPPIFIAFFVTAGAHLRIDLIPQIWALAIIYTLARMIGKISGASFGAKISKADSVITKYIGFGLISQVGVAIGLALVVAREFTPLGPEGKELASIIINLLLTTTIITEVVGPLLTKFAIIKSGDAKA